LFVLGVFALLAVVLTAIGVYGVVAYATARRTREIAVRLALGADARRIVGLVVRDGLMWTLAGLIAGVLGALVLTRYLESLLFGVTPTDAVTFTTVAVLLGAIAAVATALPAIRAVRTDPMLALRSE
jgi:ABC-type antimicrobial peptide transport system permease subunit